MPEFRSFRAESIVLKHHDWGEADRIITVFSREQGKLRVVAKGVRKIRSRRAGHLEPFTHVMLQLARSSDLPIVTQADTVESFSVLREDLEAIGHASYIVELLDKFTYQEGANVPLFNLLKRTLERLAAGKAPAAKAPAGLVLRFFEMRLLDLAGFRPELSTCVICGEEIRAENQFFSAARGGVVCPRPVHKQAGLVPVSVDALRFLRHFQRSSYSEATRAHPSPGADREMEMVMQHYITYVLERGLNTPKFIRSVK